jgi:signal peptidase I
MGRRSKGLNFNKRRRNIESENVAEFIKMLTSIVAAIIIAWFIIYAWGTGTEVIGSGMEPTFYNGQTVFISRFSYLIKRPKAGDIVVFLPNGNQNTHYYVKRVVAVPGDVVVIKGNRLYVNEKEYESEVEYDKIADPGIASNDITLMEDEYFVLGDNVNTSEDSRSGNVGMVSRKLIDGRVWFKLKAEDSHFGFVN